MNTPPFKVVACIPIIVRCLDAHGRPVSLSATSLVRSSTALQALLRQAFVVARGGQGPERLTVSFHEQERGELQAALAKTTMVVAAAVKTIEPLDSATSARWSEAETPDFVDVVLDGQRTVRLPRALQNGLGDETALDLMRQTLRMFVDDDVERMVVDKEPETPISTTRSWSPAPPGLVDFIRGGPLTCLRPAARHGKRN